MFLKLWKHELRASGKLLGMLSVTALSVGIAAAVLLRLILHLVQQNISEDSLVPLLVMGMGVGFMGLILALMAYSLGVQIYLYWRFYKHKFTDEGYLTFTLPVSSHQIFFSALANHLLWSVISVLVVIIAAGIILLFGTGTDQLVNMEVLNSLPTPSEMMGPLYGEIGNPVLDILMMLTMLPFVTVVLMSCITVGAVLAKKHKLLMAFGVYYGVNMVVGIGQTILSVAGTILFWNENQQVLYGVIQGITLALQWSLIVGGCWLSIWLMDKKLNLP